MDNANIGSLGSYTSIPDPASSEERRLQHEKLRVRTNRFYLALPSLLWVAQVHWGGQLARVWVNTGIDAGGILIGGSALAAVFALIAMCIPALPRRVREVAISYSTGCVFAFLLMIVLGALDIQIPSI